MDASGRPMSGTVGLATFGSGCFWCTEAVFEQLEGVLDVTSGYCGGHVENPTYKAVCTGRTGHAEVVQIRYDPERVSYPELLEVFWRTHDPTTPNRQGNDVGTQYRSVIFCHDAEQRRLAEGYLKKLNASGAFRAPVVTEIAAAGTFYPAEEYHQDYFARNPRQAYCQAIIAPKVEKFQKVFHDKLKGNDATSGKVRKSDREWKAQLTNEQYRVTRQKGTEQAFTGKYWNERREGVYRCVCCGQPLFESTTKFDAGCGWPSFYKPIDQDHVDEAPDNSHFMRRTEILCSKCDAHLGHVFADGPQPTGLRYCVNSASLEFEEKAKADAKSPSTGADAE